MNEDIAKLKKDMIKMDNEKSRGVLTRSRVQHLEENEKCTRYFFNKLVMSRHCIEGVLDREGKEESDPEGVLDIVKSFYCDLYKDRTISEESTNDFFVIFNHKT